MTVQIRKTAWPTVAGLALLVILGGCLRLYNIGEKSITHVEMYVPGIRLPHGISFPEERLTIAKVLTGTLNSDTHPPAFYMLMWCWTKCFGISAFSVRLPSALLGTACIPLIFWLGILTRQRAAGWIAAALLALNGHHVFWSQIARMFTLACFLGLLATLLLLMIAQDRRPSSWLGYLYVLVALIGLASHIFFWLILGCHIVWTLLNAWIRRQPFPGILGLQILALILGSPLLAFAAYQNGNTLATLSSNIPVYVREYLQFAFAFPLQGYSSGVFPDTPKVVVVDDPHLSLARWLYFLLSVVVFVAGVASTKESEEELPGDPRGPSWKSWLLAAGLGALAILAFVVTARAFAKPPNPTLKTTELMIVLPFLLAGIAILLQRKWTLISSWRNSALDSRFLIGDQALVLMLALLPFVTLAVVSRLKPIFAARGMLLLTPYLLLVLSWGIVRLSRYKALAGCLLLAVGFAHYEGLKQYHHMSAGRANYKLLAATLSPRIENTDLVFLNPEFYSTPLFFYMNSNWDRIVGKNYLEASRQNPRARIWALWFYNYEKHSPAGIERVLSDHQPIQTIEAPGVQAILYAPKKF